MALLHSPIFFMEFPVCSFTSLWQHVVSGSSASETSASLAIRPTETKGSSNNYAQDAETNGLQRQEKLAIFFGELSQ
jgi:hypothetical protein